MNFRAPILIYFMTVTMGTGSQIAGSSSYFYKWREHTEYRLPVTSLEITYKATSEAECATVCSDRTGLEPCAAFAFIFIDNQWTCALAVKDSSGSGPNFLKTSYSDDLYINEIHREPQATGETDVSTEVSIDQTTTEQIQATTINDQPTTEAEGEPVYTIPDINVDNSDCDGGWKYDHISNTLYCFLEYSFLTHDDLILQCDPLHANSYAVAINTIEEHQFLVDNVPANQVGGATGICYHTSGREDPFIAGRYTWLTTMDTVTVPPDAYCNPPTAECITMDHGCNMKLETRDCNAVCSGICELHP